MTRIYLIRHGETQSNLENRIQGWLDTQLTEAGFQQAEALGQRFQNIPVDAVYASDLQRAMDTAQVICNIHNLPLHTDPALREMNLGEWSGQTTAELSRTQGEQMALFRAVDPQWHAPGGETYLQLRDRVDGALQQIVANHPGQTVAVVSHGGGIKQVLAKYKGLSVSESKDDIKQGNTSVNLIEFDGEEIRVTLQGDTSHLAYLDRKANTYNGY